MPGLASRVAAKGWAQVNRVRDRGFAPSLRHDTAAPALVLSPHLDDAVIDCWSVLTRPGDVVVATLFAGEPAGGVLVHWDRLAGGTSSAALMRERRGEDAAALALAGRAPVHLDLLADPYRGASATPTLGRIDAALAAAVPAASRVFAPAVLGTVHPDHALVRAYAVALARSGVPVELYADQPYAVTYGWPHWVTGDAADPHLDVDLHWSITPGLVDPVPRRDAARVVALDAEARGAKLAAMRTYASQFPMLDRGPVGQLSTPSVHGFEVFWTLAG